MKSGTTQMKNILKDVSIDDVDTIADDLDDSMRDATEIANALSRPMGMNDPEEDELIMAEMDGWEDDKVVVEKVIDFPELPERKIKEEKKKIVKE
jgi:adenylosuccinate synthase